MFRFVLFLASCHVSCFCVRFISFPTHICFVNIREGPEDSPCPDDYVFSDPKLIDTFMDNQQVTHKLYEW
jgi:hypothetical protein